MLEVKEMLIDLQHIADDRIGKDEMCIFSMYQAFMQQYKEQNGSYKKYIRTQHYESMMQLRDDVVVERINDVLESKLEYHKKYESTKC